MSCRILTIGDICLKGENTAEFVSADIKNIMKEHQMVTCDMGIVALHENMKAIQKAGPHESQSANSVFRCREAGITMARLAGNHIMDYGIEGAEWFMQLLDEQGIEHIGADRNFHLAYEPLIRSIDGIRLAFFSVGQMEFGCADEDGKSGFAWVNSHELEKNILNVKEQADYIFLFVHAGVEDTMVPMREWRTRYRTLIHLGCDFIVATHPHIVQGIESYEGGLIAYSLGNFAYDLLPECRDEVWNTSIMLSFELEKGKKYKYQIYPVKYKDGMVFFNQEDAAFDERFSKANQLLSDDIFYQKELDRTCTSFFERYYYAYYVKHAIKDGIIDPVFLFHNIGIESHSYLCRHALQIKNQKEAPVRLGNPYQWRYLLWGMGKLGRKTLRYCKNKQIDILGVTDSNRQLWETEILGERVLPPSEVKERLRQEKNLIGVICSDGYYGEIRYTLSQEYGCNVCISWEHLLAALLKWEIETV